MSLYLFLLKQIKGHRFFFEYLIVFLLGKNNSFRNKAVVQ